MLDALGRVPGVGEARLFSQYDYSMRIWLDIERLTNLGLIPADVVDAIGAQNVLAPVGRIGAQPMPDDQQLEIVLQPQGRLTEVEEFRNNVLRRSEELRVGKECGSECTSGWSPPNKKKKTNQTKKKY